MKNQMSAELKRMVKQYESGELPAEQTLDMFALAVKEKAIEQKFISDKAFIKITADLIKNSYISKGGQVLRRF
jgi:hypothetical protein